MTTRRARRLTLAFALVSFLTALFFWQIYYALLCFNYLHPLVSMTFAQKIAATVPFFPHIVSLALAFLADRASYRAPRNFAWRTAGLVLPVFSFVVALGVIAVADPAFGTRSYQAQFHDARIIAGNFAAYPNQFVSPDGRPRTFPTFVDLAADLPHSAASNPHASEIILAIDTVEIPGLGVVFADYNNHQWLYFNHSRAVAFADGHADLIPTFRLPALLARSNAHRAALGLPPSDLPPTRPKPY